MLFAGLSFWAIGFTGAYVLAFPGGLGVYGVWIGFSLGVGTFAALLIGRFHALTSRHYLPLLVETDDAAIARSARPASSIKRA
jgi:MATE family multidrug resistance protein